MNYEDDLARLASRFALLAGMDELTRLSNLRQFVRELTRELARARRTGVGLQLLVMEMEPEDDVAVFARRLVNAAQEDDILARIGHRRLADLMTDLTEVEGIGRAAEIQERLGSTAPLAVGFRFVRADELESATAASVLQDAVRALEAARAAGDGLVVEWPGVEPMVN